MDSYKKNYKSFSNKECEYYPCHKTKDDINCLFCYCPLYQFGKKCEGNYKYIDTKNGKIKDCSACLIPHKKENYGYIIDKLNELNRFSNIKAVAMDLDHTLLSDEFETDEETMSIFPKLKEAGYKSIICTARFYAEAYYFAYKFKPDYMICDNGARIVEYKDEKEKVIFEQFLPKDIQIEIIEALEEFKDVFYVFETEDDLYINNYKHDKKYLKEALDYAYKTQKVLPKLNVHIFEDMKEIPKEKDMTRLYLMDFLENEKLQKTLSAIGEKYKDRKLVYICSFQSAYEFGILNKGDALKILIEHMGISKENIMSFGDSLADIPMLNNSGISVAMGNAKDELKAVSDYVAESVFEHGVLKFLEEKLF